MVINRKNDLDRRIEKTNLNVLESGMAIIDESWRCDDVLSVYNRVYYIIEGDGANLGSENEHIVMKPGHIYLIPAGYRYRYWCEGIVKKVYFHISIKRNDGYDALSGFRKIGVIDDAETVKRIERLYQNDYSYSCLAIKGELLKTVAGIAEKYSLGIVDGDENEYSQVLRRAVKYIQKNLSIKLSRDEIAEHCRVSAGKLAICFKSELGVSVGKYIDDLVLMEAMRRLTYTEDPIGVISEELGFCDQFYFSRRFRELCRISPLKYRLKMQNSK